MKDIIKKKRKGELKMFKKMDNNAIQTQINTKKYALKKLAIISNKAKKITKCIERSSCIFCLQRIYTNEFNFDK